MTRLTHNQFATLLNGIGELHVHHDLDGFAQLAMRICRKAVPSDWAAWDEINVRRQRHHWFTEPAELDLRGPDEAHKYLFTQHPFVKHMQRYGDVPALRISDLLSRRQYHETGLYREAYRHFGVEYQLGFSLPSSSPGLFVGMAFNRKHHDFSGQDRLLFELLRPHLLQAYRNAELITQLRETSALANHALEATRQGLIMLDALGCMRFCSASARRWLAHYFGVARRTLVDKLPEEIQQWLRRQQRPTARSRHIPATLQPLTVEQNGRRLVVRQVAGPMPGQQLLVLEERATTYSPAPLQRLGLTAREAEVLLWVTQGKTSPDIGMILNCRTATVNKHLEHIFTKLGVETRTAAALRAMDVLIKDGD